MLFFILFFLTDQEFNYLENAILSINRKGAQFIRELCCLILCRVVEYITEDGIRRYLKSVKQQYQIFTTGKDAPRSKVEI